MAKQELLKWINDPDAVNLTLKMLATGECVKCGQCQYEGSDNCARCGKSYCVKCKNGWTDLTVYEDTKYKNMDICSTCNDIFCHGCGVFHCNTCGRGKCKMEDELCNWKTERFYNTCYICCVVHCQDCIGELAECCECHRIVCSDEFCSVRLTKKQRTFCVNQKKSKNYRLIQETPSQIFTQIHLFL